MTSNSCTAGPAYVTESRGWLRPRGWQARGEGSIMIIERCHSFDALQVPLGSQDAINRTSTVVGLGSGKSQATKAKGSHRPGEAKEEGQTQVCADASTCAYPSPPDKLISICPRRLLRYARGQPVPRQGVVKTPPASTRSFHRLCW